MSGWVRRGLLLGLVSVASVLVGAFLIAAGAILRQERMVADGKRRFHGRGLDRRWISDLDERERHAEVVAERLDLDPAVSGTVSVAEAARRLGVSTATVRRRAKRGQLEAVYREGRLIGIIIEAD